MAKRPRDTVVVGVCLVPGAWAATASLALDLVQIASVIARATPGARSIEGRFLGPAPGDITTANGTPLPANQAWEGTDVDLLVLPSVAIPALDTSAAPPGLASWVGHQHQNGALVIAIGTGGHLLAATGLLDRHPATTHWAFLDRCRRDYPAVAWSGEQRLAVTGRIVTARDLGAATTAVCHAIGVLLDPSIGERVYRYSLVHEPGSPALPPLHTIDRRDHGDPQILLVQDWIETHYARPLTATDAAGLVHLSTRTLRRRFQQATGQTMLTYLTDVRLAHARTLLLSTSDPITAIAHQIGYADVSTFTALFRQHHGLPPGAYRRSATSTAP